MSPTLRRAWLGILILALVWLGVLLFPVGTRTTRLLFLGLTGLLAGATATLGLVSLWPRHRQWLGTLAALLALPLLAFAFRAFSPPAPDVPALRAAYVKSLERFGSTRYVWGGEGPLGVDCSGLVRRAMVNALVFESFRRWDPALLKPAAQLWWHDATAAAMAQPEYPYTEPLFTTPSLNALDSSCLQPGDLAITKSGIHILAFLGGQRWIEADPAALRTLILTTPSENAWFHGEMTLVRWSFLTP